MRIYVFFYLCPPNEPPELDLLFGAALGCAFELELPEPKELRLLPPNELRLPPNELRLPPN